MVKNKNVIKGYYVNPFKNKGGLKSTFLWRELFYIGVFI